MITYDKLAKEYNDRWNIQHQEEVLTPFIDIVKEKFGNTARILDVGCGTGLDLFVLMVNNRQFDLNGMDASPEMIKYAEENVSLGKFTVGDFTNAEPPEEKYDAIILDAFIHLFPSNLVRQILEKVKDFLVPNGIIFVCTTVHNVPYEGFVIKSDYTGEHKRFRKQYTREEFKDILNDFKMLKFYEDTETEYDKKWMNAIVQKK